MLVTLPKEILPTPVRNTASPKLAPAALLTGITLLKAKSKVIKPESSFTFCSPAQTTCVYMVKLLQKRCFMQRSGTQSFTG